MIWQQIYTIKFVFGQIFKFASFNPKTIFEMNFFLIF